MPTIDDIIALYKKRLAKAEQIRDIIGDDPAFARELLNVLQATAPVEKSSSKHPRKPVTKEDGTHLQRITTFFNETGNELATVEQIAAGAGLKRTSVAQIIYKSKPNKFEKTNHPTHGLRKLWRLKV